MNLASGRFSKPRSSSSAPLYIHPRAPSDGMASSWDTWGEAVPFWLWSLDYMASPGSRGDLRNQLKASEYFRRNFAITTSGLEDPLVLRFCVDKIGIENVMWAIDYPYQPTAPVREKEG